MQADRRERRYKGRQPGVSLEAAFTLIELLVVLGIIGVLADAGLGFGRTMHEQALFPRS